LTASATIEELRKRLDENAYTAQQHEETLHEKQTLLEVELSRRTAAEQRIDELGKQVALKEAARAESEVRLQTKLDDAERRLLELANQAQTKISESADLRQRCEEHAQQKETLEARLTEARKQQQELTARISELESELSHTGDQLREERQSAANRMDLLVKAQQSLAQLVQAACSAPAPHDGADGVLALPGLADSAQNLCLGHEEPQLAAE